MKRNIAIGIDFGTLSARGIVLDLATGEVINAHTSHYKNGVIDEYLPNTDIKLESGWALQNAHDYINAMESILDILSDEFSESDHLLSIGTTFTSSTVLPVDENMTPLMFKNDFKNIPHAWPKLWKHNASQRQADRINEQAIIDDCEWLRRYGGKISAEWMFPKALQILEEEVTVYEAMNTIIEAGDWITYVLTNTEKRSRTQAGFKAMYVDGQFPKKDFLRALNPAFENFVEDKLVDNYYLPEEAAGLLKKEYKELMKINYDVVVSVSTIDAHAAIASFPIIDENSLYVSAGTSSCDIMLNKNKLEISGISGIIDEGVVRGYYAYESGQPAVGDMFTWFIDNLLPKRYFMQADKKSRSVYQELELLLDGKENDLVMLDWMNGNRSTLMDSDLTGLILGLKLSTKPEEIYHAMIESTAFGKRKIVEQYENEGVQFDRLFFAGGLPQKNKLFNQIYADVLQKNLIISEYEDNGAVGVAIISTVAAKYFNNVEDALGIVKDHKNIVRPNFEKKEYYDNKYALYEELYTLFGEKNLLMKKL